MCRKVNLQETILLCTLMLLRERKIQKKEKNGREVEVCILIVPDNFQTTVKAQMRRTATRGSLLKLW